MTMVLEECKKIELPAKSKRKKNPNSPTMREVSIAILGGGKGTRLFPLTLASSKPGVNFGGYYRLIDIAISNAINSCCNKIYIITQFFSTSLHQHIYRTYRDDFFSKGHFQLLPAEERPSRQGWFLGTADAVRQNLDYLLESSADYFLILSGDQVYSIDFQKMLQFAHEKDADLTIASLPIDSESAKRMGILQTDRESRITDFHEKPQDPEALSAFKIPSKSGKKPSKNSFLASMGIYLFKRQALVDLLESDQREDFGKHLIPTKVSEKKTFAYIYDGYWEDIGTIESFHSANIALTQPNPAFNCYLEQNPIFCKHSNLPGPKILDAHLKNAIICEGAIVEASEITNSILGPRTVIRKGSIIKDSYLMGNDFYVPPKHSPLSPNLSVGENTTIFKAIVDKNSFIGNNVQLINKNHLTHFDSPSVYIRDGIIVVPRGAIIPDGFIL